MTNDIKALLIFFHCHSNTGYAISSLEAAFWAAAVRIFDPDNIHFAYPDISRGLSETIDGKVKNLVEFDPYNKFPQHLEEFSHYLQTHNIHFAFGFDQQVSTHYYKTFRKSGIESLISYYGAPISSVNSGLKLLLKKLGVWLTPNKPDLFIFESEAMLETAVNGRGIAKTHTNKIYLGVDTDKFKPNKLYENHAYETFSIPKNRKIIFYSGHMEERKGVHIIIEAAIKLVDKYARNDVHFLILGNQPGEETRFLDTLQNTKATKHVTFGGYRKDISQIHNSCLAGVIASTGWDSLTMSSIEMASSGLPLIVSDLGGLPETITEGVSGYRFTPGSSDELVNLITALLDDVNLTAKMAKNARIKALQCFSKERQIADIQAAMSRTYFESSNIQ